MTIISSIATTSRRVALTFDDGPHPEYTPLVLDALTNAGARATFFVRGGALESETTEIVRRAAVEGHEIGNHTHSHLNLDKQRRRVVAEEVEKTHAQLTEIVGRPPTVIRPPYGLGLKAVDKIAAQLGYRATVAWNISPKDWLNPDPAEIVERVMSALAPGAIVLLHDGLDGHPHEGRYGPSGTVEALPVLLARIHQANYELVTVSQLLNGSA